MKPLLYVGNYNYSSWSLRPWLCLKWAGIGFDETRIELDQPGYAEGGVADVLAVSPSGKVPVLHLGAARIWDGLAIAEWAAEQPGATPIWPKDPLARAEARSVAAEMHSGFSALRRDLPMNIRRRCRASGLPEETLRNIARIDGLWSELRERHAKAGAFLFGPRSVADAFYVPVAARFRTYATALSPAAQAYCDALLADTAFLDWERKALAEPGKPFSRAEIDGLYVKEP